MSSGRMIIEEKYLAAEISIMPIRINVFQSRSFLEFQCNAMQCVQCKAC